MFKIPSVIKWNKFHDISAWEKAVVFEYFRISKDREKEAILSRKYKESWLTWTLQVVQLFNLSIDNKTPAWHAVIGSHAFLFWPFCFRNRNMPKWDPLGGRGFLRSKCVMAHGCPRSNSHSPDLNPRTHTTWIPYFTDSRFVTAMCRVIPGHRNWQIETAVWNLAGFFTVGLEPRRQRFGQFLNDLWFWLWKSEFPLWKSQFSL